MSKEAKVCTAVTKNLWVGGLRIEEEMSVGDSVAAVMDSEGDMLKLGGRNGDRTCSFGKRRAVKLEELVDSLSRAYNEKIGQVLQQHEYNFVLSDPRLPDHPIVFASEGFLRMSGYDREEVLGRNCRFLQGPDTDRGTVVEIRDAIREERACQVRILNYTKQGEPFWNLFHMAPIFSNDGRVIHYVGVQTPIAKDLLSEAVTAALPAEDGSSVPAEESAADLRGDSLHSPDESSVNMRLRGGGWSLHCIAVDFSLFGLVVDRWTLAYVNNHVGLGRIIFQLCSIPSPRTL